ncbi:hypothetical protein GCM10029976_037440 [Kribbella albertanoniae]|uniref:MmyB family transcriptional regulator n=1 Tax=Kribbella albertanoniae TaxID=1266829 RepID=UPI00192E0F79|nr:hypothetical protein [Kribbella albertanoniae]
MTDDEHAYVFDLTRQWTPVRRQPQPESSSLAALVQALSPLPAMLINHRFDIRAWNPELELLMLNFAGVSPERRNAMVLCTLEPAFFDYYTDRERIIREGIADLRAAWAAHADDEDLAELVRTLCDESSEFAELWARRDVKVKSTGRKRLNHPDVGRLTVEYDVLTPLGDTAQRLIVYRAIDAASQRALDRIAAMVAQGDHALAG